MRLSRIITEKNRAEIVQAVAQAPLGAQVELRGPRRTSEQNRLMWKLLGAFADQVEHFGRKYDPETWKCIGMKALGKELQFVPGLGGEVVALGYRSSQLSKVEMSDLIELLYSEGAKRGVDFEEGGVTAGEAWRGEAWHG